MKHEQAYDRKLATRIVLLYAGAMLILFVALGSLVRRESSGTGRFRLKEDQHCEGPEE